MALYEAPKLLEVGSVEGVVLGDKVRYTDQDGTDSGVSTTSLSVLDVD